MQIVGTVGLIAAQLLSLLTTTRSAEAIVLDDGWVALYDASPRDFYVSDVGFEGSLGTPFDDEAVFGRGDAGNAPGPWVFQRLSNAMFSVSSNDDDSNFDAVVARLTDGIDEQFSVFFWHVACFGGGCVFGSEQVSRRPESEWFNDLGLTGVRIDEIRFDWTAESGPNDYIGTATISLIAVPEPSTGLLVASGLLALRGWWGRRPG